MRFIKGDFKDLQCNDISVETTCHKNGVVDSDYYPSAEIACTRDNLKSLSTTTTANRLDKENNMKYSLVKGLISNQILMNEDHEEQENGSDCKNDPTFSPPLARQLFAKHGLFDIEEMEDDQPLDLVEGHPDWFEEEDNRKIPLSLQKISEAPESNSSISSGNFISRIYFYSAE